MTALLIIGGILLALFALLLSPVRLYIAFRDELTLTAGYLFVRYDLSPSAMEERRKRQQEKPEKKKKKKKEPQPEDEEQGKEKKKTDFSTIWNLVKSAPRGLSILRRHLLWSKIEFYASIAKKDAHQTALAFGQTRVAAAALLDILSLLFVVKGKPSICIAPDYTAEAPKFRMEAAALIRIRPLFALAAGLSVLRAFLKQQNERKRRGPARQRELVKGGKTA